jgi:hypothetical protein
MLLFIRREQLKKAKLNTKTIPANFLMPYYIPYRGKTPPEKGAVLSYWTASRSPRWRTFNPFLERANGAAVDP